jgi:hypothetical protein
MGAYCLVKKHKSSKPTFVFVEINEYHKGQSVWKEKPATMIKKVAEAQALRAAFQDLFGGTYAQEEEWEAKHGVKEVEINPVAPPANPTDNVLLSKLNEQPKAHKYATLMKKMAEMGVSEAKIFNYFDISSLDEITDEQRKEIISIGQSIKTGQVSVDEAFTNVFEQESDKVVEGELVESPVNDTPAMSKQAEAVAIQLRKAKSQDTLDLAADLIRSAEPEFQEALSALYQECKAQLS